MDLQKINTGSSQKMPVKSEFIYTLPLGFMFRALISYKEICSLDDLTKFKNERKDESEYIDKVFAELIDTQRIHVDPNGTIQILNDDFWESSDPLQAINSTPELLKIIARRGLTDKSQGIHDPYLDFASIVQIPNDEELLKETRQAVAEFYTKLMNIHDRGVKLDRKTSGVRCISVAGGRLKTEDF